MFRQSFKRFSALLCSLMMSCLLVLPLDAATYLTDIPVRMGLNLNLNGQYVAPVDASGQRVPVFLYESTTYVPVRFISQYYGLSVNWNASSATVSISGSAGLNKYGNVVQPNPSTWLSTVRVRSGLNLVLNGRSVIPKDASGRTVPVFLYGSTTYVPVRFISESLGLNVAWKASTSTVEIRNNNGGNADNGLTSQFLSALQRGRYSASGAAWPGMPTTLLSGLRFTSGSTVNYQLLSGQTGSTTYTVSDVAYRKNTRTNSNVSELSGYVTLANMKIGSSTFNNVKMLVFYGSASGQTYIDMTFQSSTYGSLLTISQNALTFFLT